MIEMLILRGIFALVSIGSLVIFGRLLDARQFGLMAMATTILSVVGIFRDFGLAAAAIQKEHMSEADRDELFFLSIIVAFCALVFVIVAAPLFAALYAEHDLVPVLIVSGISYLAWGLQAQHAATLRRRMRFKAILLAEGVGVTSGLAVGAIVAYLRQDVWALVANNLTQAVLTAAFMFHADPWLPRRWRKPQNLRHYLSFGRDYMSHALLSYLSANWGQIVLGLRFGPTELGYFNRAQQLFMFPQTLVLGPLQEVTTPVLSRLQSDPERFAAGHLQLLQRSTLIMFPIAGLLPFVSVDVVHFLLGRGWNEAATILGFFAPAIAMQGIITAVQVGLLAMGRVAEMRNFALLDAILKLAAALAGMSYGGVGVAITMSVTGLLVAAPIGIMIMASKGPSAGTQFRAVLEAGLVGLSAAASGYLLQDQVHATIDSSFLRLVTLSAGGFFIAGIVALALPGCRGTILTALTFFRGSKA